MNDTAIRSRWVLANGVRTHYAEAGDQGRTLVALHGGGAGSSGASGMGPVLPLLAGISGWSRPIPSAASG